MSQCGSTMKTKTRIFLRRFLQSRCFIKSDYWCIRLSGFSTNQKLKCLLSQTLQELLLNYKLYCLHAHTLLRWINLFNYRASFVVCSFASFWRVIDIFFVSIEASFLHPCYSRARWHLQVEPRGTQYRIYEAAYKLCPWPRAGSRKVYADFHKGLGAGHKLCAKPEIFGKRVDNRRPAWM